MQTNTTGGASASELLAGKIAEAIARGEDPLGDNDDLETESGTDEVDDATNGETATQAAAETTESQTATDTAAAGAEGTGAAETTAEKKTDELDAEALAAVAAGELDVEPEVLEVSSKDFKAERAKLATDEDAVEDRWAKGELTDPERRAELRKLRDQQDALTREETTAQTIADMNRQTQQRYQVGVLTSLAAESKAAGQLDYSDAKVGAAFDRMLQAVAGDPENQGKTFKELTRLAHEGLCAVRGVRAAPPPTAAAQASAPAAAARKTPTAPTTLRTLPTAATPNTGGDALDALANLKGQDYQAAFDRLSPAQKARLLED